MIAAAGLTLTESRAWLANRPAQPSEPKAAAA